MHCIRSCLSSLRCWTLPEPEDDGEYTPIPEPQSFATTGTQEREVENPSLTYSSDEEDMFSPLSLDAKGGLLVNVTELPRGQV